MVDISYAEMRKRVLDIIRKPLPEQVSQSYTDMVDVFRESLVELQQEDKSIQIGAWMKFNRLTGGLREREFSILCGPTGVGKTSLLSNLAVQLVSNFTPVFVASVETGSNDFMKKMISVVTGKDISSGRQLMEKEVQEVDEIVGKLFRNRNSVFSNYDSRVDHITLLCDLLHAHETKGVRVALIDNLNFLMDVKEAKNQLIDMDRAIHDFIIFVKHVPIHVIMVMHPRKTDNGRVESEFDVKGSSTAIQEAANVILWNRLENESDAPSGYEPRWCREIKFAKLRKRGRSVGARVIYALEGSGDRLVEANAR